MCLRLGIDLKIFHTLTERNGEPITVVDLGKTCDAEALLISS